MLDLKIKTINEIECSGPLGCEHGYNPDLDKCKKCIKDYEDSMLEDAIQSQNVEGVCSNCGTDMGITIVCKKCGATFYYENSGEIEKDEPDSSDSYFEYISPNSKELIVCNSCNNIHFDEGTSVSTCEYCKNMSSVDD